MGREETGRIKLQVLVELYEIATFTRLKEVTY